MPAVSDAPSLFTVEIEGGIVTVIPVAPQGGLQLFPVSGGFIPQEGIDYRVYAFDVTLLVSWEVSVGARTWSTLAVGTPTGTLETATMLESVGALTTRTAANLVVLLMSGASDARTVEVGDIVGAGTVLFSACAVEGRLDAAVEPTAPVGWNPISGAPALSGGTDPDNTRRILFVAARTMAARGAVPAATWAVEGPADALARTTIVAVAGDRDELWKDPMPSRAVNGTISVDVRIDEPIVNLVPPVSGYDFTVDSGTISTVSLETDIAGVSVRISITGVNAVISGLRLRGNIVTIDEQVTAVDDPSVAAHGRSSVGQGVSPYISRSEAQAIADEIVEYSRYPRSAWDVTLDGSRDMETRDASLETEVGDRVRALIDGDFDRDGEVIAIRHELSQPANILKTTFTMLAAETTP